MDLFVTFIGTAASVPTASRGTAATLLSRGGERWLVDCGEGTQRQLLRSGLGLVDLDLVLITHLHGDHYLGLPGMFKTFGLRGRERPLLVIGPPGLVRLMETLAPIIGRLPFPVDMEEVSAKAPETAWEGDGFHIGAFPTRHSVPSVGYVLAERDRPGAFDIDAARALGVPEGPQFGVLQRGGEVTTPEGRVVRPDEVMGEPRSGRVVVLTGDTEPCDATLDASRGAQVLVHEATFLDEDRARARETRHSTAREAAELGREADVGLLALTHLSSRFHPREVRREAEEAFDRVVVPRDFDQVEVPFPERGAPVVHSVRDRREGDPPPGGVDPVVE
ncbi:MAG: ribonuclease Z, partial [Thermoleophilia bacterium]